MLERPVYDQVFNMLFLSTFRNSDPAFWFIERWCYSQVFVQEVKEAIFGAKVISLHDKNGTNNHEQKPSEIIQNHSRAKPKLEIKCIVQDLQPYDLTKSLSLWQCIQYPISLCLFCLHQLFCLHSYLDL